MKQNSLRQAREFSNSQILDKKDKSRIIEFKNFYSIATWMKKEFSNSQILDKKDKSRIIEFKNFYSIATWMKKEFSNS